MAIIITISAMAIPRLVSAINVARIARATGDIRTLEDEITLYLTINGQFPDSLAAVGYGTLLDPWGNSYQYFNHADGQGNGMIRQDLFFVPLNSEYDLYSMGKDGVTAPSIAAAQSQDDVIRGGNGSYVGPASGY